MIPLRDDNPTYSKPIVTYIIIGLCVVVFLLQLAVGEDGNRRLRFALGVIPAVLIGGYPLPAEIALVPPSVSVLTSMFLHGGFMHLAGNMLYLWIFGDNIEDNMGHVRYVVFYLLCGIAAVLAQAVPDPSSPVPMIGASGAISGVLGAYALLHPHAKVLVAIPGLIVGLPAMVVLGLWFVLQFLGSLVPTDQGGGIAFRAHIGGFVAGMVLLPLFRSRSRRQLGR